MEVVNLPRHLSKLAPEILSRMPSFIDCEPKQLHVKVDLSLKVKELRHKLLQNTSDYFVPIAPSRKGITNTGQRICWLISLIQFLLRLRCVTSFKKISFANDKVESCLLNLMKCLYASDVVDIKKYTNMIIDCLLSSHEQKNQQDAHEM